MSADDVLTDRDTAALDAATASPDDETNTEGSVDARRRALRTQDGGDVGHLTGLASRIEDLESELEAERDRRRELVQLVNRLQDAVEGNNRLVGRTTLEKYSVMPEDDRDDLLSTSEQRAVAIYEHWDELAWRANGRLLLETGAKTNQKNQPSKIKYRLERFFDTDLQANEIYRAMKAVARLSGGEASTDEHGRTHITGGEFEYHVETTADNSGTRRVLQEAER